MREGQPTAIQREAYAAPAFWIDTVDLTSVSYTHLTLPTNREV